MSRYRLITAAAAALVCAIPATAQVTTPGSPILVAATALIESSGAPAEFTIVTDAVMLRVKHNASGLICTFPAVGENRLTISHDGGATTVGCIMKANGVEEVWGATSAAPPVDFTGAFDNWTAEQLAANPGWKTMAKKQGIDAAGPVGALARTLPPTKRAGWLNTGPKSLTYYGVADAAGWRLTYISSGNAGMVSFLAPMVWLSGIQQVVERGQTGTAL